MITVFNIQEELKKLPDLPGVYIMKDCFQNIIYIGKAVNLKNRVRQYFQHNENHTQKVLVMVSQIAEFEYIITDSELEALILECNLIKKHKPKYNILLKDDKHYPYIKITINEEYPRVLITRKIEKDGAKYFGPYSNATAVRDTIDIIKKVFPIKGCNKKVIYDTSKGRPCLNFHIKQCLGPCQGNVHKDDYKVIVKDVINFLNGKQDDIIKRLENQMNSASDKLDFEQAALLRDKIISLKHIKEKQKVLSTAMEDQDIIAFAKNSIDSIVQVFFVRGGKLIGRENFVFENIGSIEDTELMSSFIKQFYNTTEYIPDEIILKTQIDELNIIEKWLSDKRNDRVYIKVPQKGEKLHLAQMVEQNAVIALNAFTENIKKEKEIADKGLKSFVDVLQLDHIPYRIESYDISNTGDSDIVAAMVVFENGISNKKEYRRFKIKSINEQNDYASMQEVIYRRFRKDKNEKKNNIDNDSKYSSIPDLILIDGGLGHVNSVYNVLEEINIKVPVYGMVKDDNHRTRGIITRSSEISLINNINALRFITSIQDETHRFAIEYNKFLRKKRYTTSVLDEIEGIGPKRKKLLIKHFGSINKIKNADLKELLKVEGISETIAESIYMHFH